MAAKSGISMMATLLILALVLSPVLPTEAARFTNNELFGRTLLQEEIICPACVCCTPAPPGECCECCASPIETEARTP
uniref:Uncharacterized protein n=1 Tax=Nelumbo nucifera TaxID=4432 RepID=A0A822ZIS6_NELNU|nr:TPA_asm: hypothetical protein HUJ06_002763 [Nelumbo nucifera]